MTLDTFVNSYVETALWSSTDDNGRPLDGLGLDVADETQDQMLTDCKAFLAQLDPILDALDDSVIRSIPSRERIAHDFWLTRNHHGAGFWDGDYPGALGKQLTDIAHAFGAYTLYVGDDGKVYGMRG